MPNRYTRVTLFILITVMSFSVYSDIKAYVISDFKVPEGFKFTKNLFIGQTLKPDVSYLQNILNMNVNTQVATGSLDGSNSNLTNYYGTKTRDAVEKFQTLFASDIQYEFRSTNSTTSSVSNIFKTNPNFIDTYTIGVLNKLILFYSNERYNANRVNMASSSPDVFNNTINTINSINNSNNKEEVVRFNAEEEKSRSTDISPTGVDKNIFAHTPEGQLAQLIGGYALVDKVYNYTPGGFINNTLSGITNGQGLTGGLSAISGAGGGLGGGSMSGVGAGTSAIQPFGGMSTSMVMCTCSANILLYIKDARGLILPLMYQPGVTMLYKMDRPTSGVNVLGQYTSGGQCLIYSGTSCSSGGSPVGTMIQLGTSLSTGK